MKTFTKLFAAMLLLASFSIGFFACDDTTESDLQVTFSIDKKVARNGNLLVINIAATTTNDKITAVTLEKGGSALTIPAVDNNENYTKQTEYVIADPDGEIEFTLTVSSENMTTPIVKKVKVTVVSDVDVTLGASTSPLPSFMNGKTLKTYNSTAAFNAQDSVDLVYTYNSTDGAIIGAPADAAFTLATWTTKHTTKVGIIAQEDIDLIDAITTTSVKNLAVSDLIGYKTDGGTKGIIVVKNIVVGEDGNATMTFSVIK